MFKKSYRNPLVDIVSKRQEAEDTSHHQKAEIVAVLNKFTKSQLLNEVTKIITVPRTGHSKRLDKTQIIENIFRVLKGSASFSVLWNRIELKYFQLHSSKRTWFSAEVRHAKLYIEADTDTVKFARKLEKHLLKSRFFCNVFSEFLDGMMWTILAISNPQRRPQMIVLVTCPGSPVFLFSGLQRPQQEQVFRAISEVFQGSTTKQLPFQSRSIRAVFQNVAKYLKLDVLLLEDEPMEVSDESGDELPENVVSEDIAEEAATKAYASETFGDQKLPPLEILTFDVAADYCGDEKLGDLDIQFQGRAIFKGQNVLEGMRKSLYMGAASYPLPDFITKVGTTYGNHITIRPTSSSSQSS